MDLCQGRLVWAYVQGRGGEVKQRPVVIITANREIKTASDLVVVVGSNSSALRPEPWPDDYIELPSDPRGQFTTKLRKKTVAVCSWVTTIPNKTYPDRDLGGIVLPARLKAIIEKATECGALEAATPPPAAPAPATGTESEGKTSAN